MIRLIRTNSTNPDFIALVNALDAELRERDGEDNAYYAQFNKIDDIDHAIVAVLGHQATGIGAIKPLDENSAEVKRMYLLPEQRGKGYAKKILAELEQWAAELSFERCVLETGKRQPEAIRLYERNGYRRIENYGPYQGIENSICFEKILHTD